MDAEAANLVESKRQRKLAELLALAKAARLSPLTVEQRRANAYSRVA